MNLKRRWKNHLTENNMSYLQHLKFAVLYGCICFIAAICLIIHAILPCFFERTGSDLVKMLVLVFKKRDQITDT
jgi:hypothetical protein